MQHTSALCVWSFLVTVVCLWELHRFRDILMVMLVLYWFYANAVFYYKGLILGFAAWLHSIFYPFLPMLSSNSKIFYQLKQYFTFLNRFTALQS